MSDEYLRWDEPCVKDICGWRCWSEAPIEYGKASFTKDVSIYYGDAGTVDGEGPCHCDHHDHKEDE